MPDLGDLEQQAEGALGQQGGALGGLAQDASQLQGGGAGGIEQDVTQAAGAGGASGLEQEAEKAI